MKIVFIDDHLPIIEGYVSMLDREELEYSYVSLLSINQSITFFHEVANNSINLVVLDVLMGNHEKINSGLQLIPLIKRYNPHCKILVSTSQNESVKIYDIINEFSPDGIIIKSDITSAELNKAINKVMDGLKYYSPIVQQSISIFKDSGFYLDKINRNILILIQNGVKTKSIPTYLNLSLSAVDKRKAQLKEFFNIEKGNDEEIIRQAQIRGFL